MIEIRQNIAFDIGQFSAAEAKRVRTQLARALPLSLRYANDIIQDAVRHEFKSIKQRLARSFAVRMEERLVGAIGTYSSHAILLDEGGDIVPKKARALVIPLTPARSPKRFKELFLLKRAGGGALLVRAVGTGKRERFVPVFILKRRVSVRGRHYIEPAIRAAWPAIEATINDAIEHGGETK